MERIDFIWEQITCLTNHELWELIDRIGKELAERVDAAEVIDDAKPS